MTNEEIRAAKIKTTKEILEKLSEIKRIYDHFRFSAQIDDPFGYLTLAIFDDSMSFHNSYWELPEEAGISSFKRVYPKDFKEDSKC